MTTAFQSVIDNATTISINKRRTVGQTVARNGAVKSTSFGGQVWQFQVELPSGPRYSLYRSTIEKLEALDRTTVGQIQFNAAGHSYISGYLGNLSNIANINVTHVSGNTVTINSGASGLAVGQFIFKAGDIIQLGASTTVTLNRPVRDGAGSYTLRVGPACVFDVICVQFPDWTIFGYDQVQWSGPFVFAEVI
mgnify:CR=1 FL=1